MLSIIETITKHTDGRYMGRFIVDHETNGKPVYQYVYGKTYDEAEQKLRIAVKLRVCIYPVGISQFRRSTRNGSMRL